MDTERKLATVRTVNDLLSIEGANRIEAAVVDGWRVIVKKGDFKVDDLAIYFEIDSWVPHTVAPFLTREGRDPKEYRGILGERLRTIKMRGQLSQGLLLPVSILTTIDNYDVLTDQLIEGSDMTDMLGVLKWEREIPAQLQGKVKGNFPSFIHKTDQKRVQNLRRELDVQDSWEVTTKLDGSSMTCFINALDMFSVCSRNWQLDETEGNTFWSVARAQDLETKLRVLNNTFSKSFALQGELVGPGIQGNQEQLTESHFYLFDIWDIDSQRYVSPDMRCAVAVKYNIDHVPYVKCIDHTPTLTESLELADGPSLNPKVKREGVVFKSMTREGVSFKAISNEWLLAGGD